MGQKLLALLGLVCFMVYQSRRMFLANSSADEIEALRLSDRFVHSGGFSVRFPRGDYLAFFRSLGGVHYLVKRDADGRAVCGVAFVLRDLPDGSRAWYVGDFFVRPECRGRSLGFTFMVRALPWSFLRCPRYFALTMGQKPAPYLKHLRFLLSETPVRFVVVTFRDLELLAVKVPRYSPLRCVDRRGMKDLVFEGQPLPLVHLCPRTAPGRPICASDAGVSFMALLLPGESFDCATMTMDGRLITLGVRGFDWLGSGDL